MKKNIYFSLMFICVLSIKVSAQSVLDSVILRVHYASQVRIFESSKRLRDGSDNLDIGKTSSHFYSVWTERNSDLNDSITAIGGKLADYLNAHDKYGYPRSSESYNVYKNYPQKGRLTYTEQPLKYFQYEEAMPQMQWEMLQVDTVIVGYPCHRARATFRGRTWLVWYTLDIPYSDGPWKLCGLPGLILEAHDEKGDFFFSCDGLENGKHQLITMRKANYIRCTPAELEKDLRLRALNFDRYAEKTFGKGPVRSYDKYGRPMIRKPEIPCLLEYFSVVKHKP